MERILDKQEGAFRTELNVQDRAPVSYYLSVTHRDRQTRWPFTKIN